MPLNSRDVFVNCPFDDEYKPLFNAIVFVVARSGYRVRCALETDDAGDNRFDKICSIISECKFGVHDISRTDPGGEPPLPRFNMPFELGLFLGAKRLGDADQKGKICIVFDRERYRFQRFLSDIAGQDIHGHSGDWRKLINELAAWLRAQPGNLPVGGGAALIEEYAQFLELLPNICAARRIQIDELSFSDFNQIVTDFVALLRGASKTT